MSKKSKNRYLDPNDSGREDALSHASEPSAEAAPAHEALDEPVEVINKGAGAALEDALAPNPADVAADTAADAIDEPVEVINQGAGAALEDALALGQEESSQEAAGQAAAGQAVPGQEAAGSDGAVAEGTEGILHSSRALEDDPAVKAAQVLAHDQAAERAEREAQVLAEDAAKLRETTKEHLTIPPLKPVDRPEDLKTAGQILRYHRQRAGLSIKEVADSIQARATSIADIEADRLNTPSVVRMVSQQVIAYARLLKLDDGEIYRLYLQGIKEPVTIEHVTVKRPSPDRRMNRIWLIVVLMIVIATAGYFVFGGKEDEAPSGALPEQSLDLSHDTSAALVTSDSKLTVGSEAPVVIEEQPAADAPQVMVVDENTAKATAQQYALQQMQAQQAQAHAQEPTSQPEALVLPEGVAHEPVAAAASEVASSVASPAASASSVPTAPVVEEVEPVAPVATVDTSPQTELPEDKAVLTPSRPATNPSTGEEPVATKDPELKASLQDISGQVKVKNRDGLASLNRAEIHVSKPVALEVTDGLGKTVRSGVFTAGDVVKITAIPPIVVKLSDTSSVQISYMGGTIALPQAQQVRFELPQR